MRVSHAIISQTDTEPLCWLGAPRTAEMDISHASCACGRIYSVLFPEPQHKYSVCVFLQIWSSPGRESTANMSQTPPMSEMKSKMEKAVKMKDEDKLYKREGILYSMILSPPETLDKLKDLEAREDDLILVAYPKCGE